jgi:single-strand DNA-binding protein
MPSYNKTILIGNFTRDPELRMLPNNNPVCDFGLAVNDRFLNKNTNQWEERPNFIDCTAFGKTAENIAKFFSKGRPIFVEGKLRFEQWEDRQSGQKRSKLKVAVDGWQFVDSKDQGGGGTRQAAGGANDGWDDGKVDDGDIPW